MYINDFKGFREFVKGKFAFGHDGKVYPVNLKKYPTSKDGGPIHFGQIEMEGENSFFHSYDNYDKAKEEIVKPVQGEFLRLVVYHNSLAPSPLKLMKRWIPQGKAPDRPLEYFELELVEP